MGVPSNILPSQRYHFIGLAMAVWTSAGISGGHVNPAVSCIVHEPISFRHNIHTFEDNVGDGDMARFPLEKGPWYECSTKLLELDILN